MKKVIQKAILLIRVSTETQEYESQKRELIAFAKGFGYRQNELTIIEHKESATKLSDDEIGILAHRSDLIRKK